MRKTSSSLVLPPRPAAAGPGHGGPRPAEAEDRSPKIAVIDMARVSAESLLGKGYAAQLEALKNEIDAEGTKKQAELQKMDAAIKALQDELEKQGRCSPRRPRTRSARRS